jgi:hypothetical protein
MASTDTASSVNANLPEIPFARHNRDRAIGLGNNLIAIKSQLPRGHWLPQVQDRSGMSYGTVQQYMRIAREAESVTI